MPKITAHQLDDIKSKAQKPKGDWIKVGLSTCGISAGADKVFETLKEEIEKKKLNVRIERCGCAGMCHAEPLVEVSVEGLPRVTYGRVDKDVAQEIVDRHVQGKKLLDGHIYQIKVN